MKKIEKYLRKAQNMRCVNKHIGIVLIFMLSILWSCNNFDELNTNPDATTTVSAPMLCTKVILSLCKTGEDKAFITQNAIPKYIGYANEGQMDEQYNKLGHVSFANLTILPTVEEMVKYAEGDDEVEGYRGVSKFARAMLFYKYTMQLGDVPYSEANKGLSGSYAPKYDKQEDVFKGILSELEEAEMHFANLAAKGLVFGGDPTPYDGDPELWQRTTNAFMLRVLMSLSKKADVASLNVKNRVANIIAKNKLLENYETFFGLEYSDEFQHSLSSTSDLFTSKTCISSLLIDNLKNLNDRRMYYFAEPAFAQIQGGLSEDDPDAYVGVDVSMSYPDMNVGHSAGEYSLLNLRYLEEYATEPRRLITYAEQQLILAEAVILGWISGDAETYYIEGVTAALTAMKDANANYAHGMAIDDDYINDYFTGEAAFKATTDGRLKQIWMQRYILNFMQESSTSYFEYRRNSYPEFPINPETSLNIDDPNAIPVRWLYPSRESTENKENLEAALISQFGSTYDDINELMWLLK